MSVLPFEPKKTVNERLKDHLTDQEKNIEAALVNEQITRERVTKIESLLSRNGWGRLNWLVRGK